MCVPLNRDNSAIRSERCDTSAMPVKGVTLKLLGLADIHWEVDESRLRRRFDLRPLMEGSCMVINRASGLALDATPDADVGTHNQLWSAHGAPWQQWKLEGASKGAVSIVSQTSRLRLTTMKKGFDWGETWQHNQLAHDWSDRWHLEPTDDRAAFYIVNTDSGFALDAGEEQTNGADPHVRAKTGGSWQQWLVLRLPLSKT